MTIAQVYSSLCTRGLFYTRFDRRNRWILGPQSSDTLVKTRMLVSTNDVRRLASRHLNHPSTDGWNVLAGAIELATQWDVVDEAAHCIPFNSNGSLVVRKRLAVCLHVAWKFARANAATFPREFNRDTKYFDPNDSHPDPLNQCTLEAAKICYEFLLDEEKWILEKGSSSNEHILKELASLQLKDELTLILDPHVCVFRAMTNNPQTRIEDRLSALIDDGTIEASFGMQIRSLSPLLIRISYINDALHSRLVKGHLEGGVIVASWALLDGRVCARFHWTEVLFAIDIIGAIEPNRESLFSGTFIGFSSTFNPHCTHEACERLKDWLTLRSDRL